VSGTRFSKVPLKEYVSEDAVATEAKFESLERSTTYFVTLDGLEFWSHETVSELNSTPDHEAGAIAGGFARVAVVTVALQGEELPLMIAFTRR